MGSLIELFCDVDNFCQVFLPVWEKQMLSSGPLRRHREWSLPMSEVMTILIAYCRRPYKPSLQVERIALLPA